MKKRLKEDQGHWIKSSKISEKTVKMIMEYRFQGEIHLGTDVNDWLVILESGPMY